MADDNIEIVRRAYERLSVGDVDGFLAACASEFELRDLPEVPGSDVFVGHDAARAWWKTFNESLDELRFEAEQLIAGGDNVVVVVVRGRGRGRASGAEVEMQVSNVVELADGRILRQTSFNDHEQALIAAGLAK